MRQLLIIILFFTCFSTSMFAQYKNYDLTNMTMEDIAQLKADRHEFYKMKSEHKNEAIKRELLNEAIKIDGNQSQWDIRYYGIDIDLNFTNGSIRAYVDYQIQPVVNNLNSIDLNLHANLIVDSVFVDGSPVVFSHPNHILAITLPTSYDIGEEFEARVYYHGFPVYQDSEGMQFGWVSGLQMCWTNCEPYASRNWWPCKDYPLDKPDSLDLYIEYPESYDVASNGIIISDDNIGGGRKKIHYKHNYPIATYLVAITCSTFDIDIQTWNYQSHSMPIYSYAVPTAGGSFNAYKTLTPDVLTYLSDAWGTYPFVEEKLGNANYGWGGAMEHQTCSFYSPTFYTEWVIAHESGHQWWGDMITCKTFHHIWLNEGFASYSEPIFYERQDGQGAYFTYMQTQKYLGPGTIYVENLNSDNIFDGDLSYDKGSWVVHMLRGTLGDAAFFQAIADYYDSEFKYASATTEDFSDVVSASVGTDMSYFFDQWIYGEGYPYYDVGWRCKPADGGGFDLQMSIEQIQSYGTLFKMPIRMTFETTGADVDTIIWNEAVDLEFHAISFDDSVTNIIIDPNEWILREYLLHSLGLFIANDDSLPDADKDSSYYYEFSGFGGSDQYDWQLTSGALPPGLTFNGGSTASITGTPTARGNYYFTIHLYDAVEPGFSNYNTFFLTVNQEPIVGDADGSWEIDISDAVFLISYIFGGGPAPDPLYTGDADCSGAIDISDAVYLIAYIFGGGPIPACP